MSEKDADKHPDENNGDSKGKDDKKLEDKLKPQFGKNFFECLDCGRQFARGTAIKLPRCPTCQGQRKGSLLGIDYDKFKKEASDSIEKAEKWFKKSLSSQKSRETEKKNKQEESTDKQNDKQGDDQPTDAKPFSQTTTGKAVIALCVVSVIGLVVVALLGPWTEKIEEEV